MLLDARSYPIQQVLENYLEPKNLAFAMRIWSTQYIDQPSISLQQFVDDFYSRQPISISSYGLYSDLLPAMMKCLQARSAFTGELINAYELADYDLGVNIEAKSDLDKPQNINKSSDTKLQENVVTEPTINEEPQEIQRDEKFVIFSIFIRQLLDGVNPERREKMIFRNSVELKSTCEPEASEAFYAWLQTDSEFFQHHLIGIDEMSAITHVLYTGLCEYQGPVDADRILMKVAGHINDNYPFASLDINELL